MIHATVQMIAAINAPATATIAPMYPGAPMRGMVTVYTPDVSHLERLINQLISPSRDASSDQVGRALRGAAAGSPAG